jgi:hypothetical protein
MGVKHDTYVELRKRYNSGWTAPPTEFPNEPFTKPSPATIWARFTIIDGDELQMDIGDINKTFRATGILAIQLFSPLNIGEIDFLQKADTLADVFRNWCGATVTCRAASVRRVGADGFGWYQINVLVPFKVDTQH